MNRRHLACVVAALVIAGFASSAMAETEYFAVFMDGVKVGHATHERTAANGKVRTTETVNMTISRLGMPLTITTKETNIETEEGRPLGFTIEQNLAGLTSSAAGTISSDGTVTMDASLDSPGQKDKLKLREGTVMAEGLRLLALRKGLKEGTQYSTLLFSAGLMDTVNANIVIGPRESIDLLGRVVSATRVQTTLSMPQMGEIVSMSYVDGEFNSLKSILPVAGMQVELVACEKEFALSDNESFEMIDKMFVASPEPLDDVGSAKAIAYQLRPAQDAGGLVIPSDDNQQVKRTDSGQILVVVEPVEPPKGARFPYTGGDKTVMQATRPTRFLQSDDKKIIALAKQAVGDTTDAAAAARRIETFVSEYVDDISLSVGYASAAEVVESKKGDCSEFAVLTAAMCRAVGIPSKVVVGIAYVEDFGGIQGFGGHAWAQAYIGDRWVGLDAAFKAGGRGGYDAGHIALASGDGEPGDFFNMAASLGKFRIEKAVVRAR